MKKLFSKILIAVAAFIAFGFGISYAASTFIVQQGGTGMSSVVPNGIVYSTNNPLGPLITDTLNTRDNTTKETHISEDDGTFTSSHILIDLDGMGHWGAGISRNDDNPANPAGAAYAVINGIPLGSPDSAVNFETFSDASGNVNSIQLTDSTGWNLTHDDATLATARLSASASTGFQARYDDANSANTFDNAFFINSSGIGWADLFGGTNFFLPTTPGVPGSVLTDVAGNGVLSFQPSSGGGGIVAGQPVTG